MPIKPVWMKKKINWVLITYLIGVVALIAGALDPLEGSVAIVAGNIALAFSTFLSKDRHFKIFLSTAVMIIAGVSFLFYFSSLGGFGGTSTLSWWWGLLILPYPIGWLINIILLIIRWQHKKKI